MGEVSVSHGQDESEVGSLRSLGQLFGEVSRELGALVQHEVELAKSQLREELDGVGHRRLDGQLGVAVVAGGLSLLFGSLALVWGLAEIMPTALAFVLVAAAYAGLAAFLVWRDREATESDAEPHPGSPEPTESDHDRARQAAIELTSASRDGR